MRIEAYTQVQQLYKTDSAKKSEAKAKVSFSDQLHISSVGKDIQTAKQAVAASADIREELVAPIKTSIQNNSYEVSSESFADKLFEKYNATQQLF